MRDVSGEVLFEKLADFLRLTCSRVSEASHLGERRPDFLVTGADGTAFYVEVKTISPTSEESGRIDRILDGEVVVSGGMPGERLRGLIQKANRQLKAVSADGIPGVLVVFNPEVFLRRHTDPYSVLTAMRGLDVVDVRVPIDPRFRPEFGELRSGPRKRMTPNANTTTAAVICPRETDGRDWKIDVYHNRHADRPFPVSAMQHSAIQHWSIAEDDRSWIPHESAG